MTMNTSYSVFKRDYGRLSREELIARLELAENVAIAHAWVPTTTGSVRGDALHEHWRRWMELSGNDCSPEANEDLVAMEPKLAAERARIREHTQQLIEQLSAPETGDARG